MKHFIVCTAAIICLGSVSFAQKKEYESKADVPPAAKSAFSKAFAGSSRVKWEKEGKNYEVNFLQQGHQMSAVYSPAGELQETEIAIKITELPAPVAEYINKQYKDAKIEEAAKITKANGEVNYEAEVNKKDVLFDAAGKFIKEAKD